MPSRLASLVFVLAPLTACTSTNDILVDLAPNVVSSIDGSLSVRAIAIADSDPTSGDSITLTVDYKDRNGTAHMIDAIKGKTDAAGTLEATFTGLSWDGAGTVTATLDSNAKVTGVATFSVLERTPPTVTIMPPANNQVRAQQDTTIAIHVKDEIGISQVWFQTDFSNGGGNGNGNNNRGRLVASGTTDTTINFTMTTGQQTGTVTLYALAADLSGNQAAAAPIVVNVVP
jgi:hypothetical protein